jgi:hypothetical protein
MLRRVCRTGYIPSHSYGFSRADSFEPGRPLPPAKVPQCYCRVGEVQCRRDNGHNSQLATHRRKVSLKGKLKS